MREWITLIENMNPLDNVFQMLADYIQHNEPLGNVNKIKETLYLHGYQEPVKFNKFFRAIFHEITEIDRRKFETVEDMFNQLRSEARLNLQTEHGFTSTLDNAIAFINATLHISNRREDIPLHSPDTPLADLRNLIVVYEVHTIPSQIIFSMRGLLELLQTANTGPGSVALKHALTDMWEGNGSDDEIFIDTRQHSSITNLYLYDTDEHL